MKGNLSPMEIIDLIAHEKLRSFAVLASNGPRPDGTYNLCREALQKRAEVVLKEIKKLNDEAMESMG